MKIKVFFFFEKESQKNDEMFQKRRVSLVQEAEKNTKLEMQQATTKVQKKKKNSKTLVPRRKEKWNKKRHVFIKEKMKKTN